MHDAPPLSGMLVLALQLGVPLLLLLLGMLAGAVGEQRHLRELEERERRLADLPVSNLRGVPAGAAPDRAVLVTGSAVYSLDYFRTFIAGLVNLVGGEMSTYRRMLVRARREATVRMLEQARALGATSVVNVRVETAPVFRGRDGKGMAAVEVLVYATALR